MPNRLANSLSPYLRQHADNPVDWHEWDAEALQLARDTDRPILLSVGYAACHWCHVMAHDSFEDAEVARVLNEGFVPIKVDREERPDIDAIYMAATQALTGQGGWPMTCVLTPDGEPFFAGTFLPRAQFLDLLDRVQELWSTRRDDLVAQAGQIVAHVRQADAPDESTDLPDATRLDRALAVLTHRFDTTHGGFGGAPKFPPGMTLEFLARHHARTGSPEALLMLTHTLDAMARGGIHDQLAGGFARYSVDARWQVPHFEKMLYDNAQLARVYAHAWRLTGDPLHRRVALETCDFMLRDLGTPGGLASSLDADSAGVEGLTYAWTPAQLVEVLGEADGRRAAELLGVTAEGTFEHGSSTLTLHADPNQQTPEDAAWWADVRARLLAARDLRPQPGRDDKVVTAWNGLAIAALAEVGVLFDRPELVAGAERIATAVTEHHLVGGRLRRTSLDGRVGEAPGQLDDHGDLAEGLLALHQATGDPRWLGIAGQVLDTAVAHFHDAGTGEWFDAPDDGEALFRRPRSSGDNAEPSGVSAIAGALLTHAALTGDPDRRALAERAIGAGSAMIDVDPRFAGWALAQAEAVLAGPLQVAITHEPGQDAGALLDVARRSPSPGLVLAHGTPDTDGVPLLAGRPVRDGVPTAHVCRGFVCGLPTTDATALAGQLGVRDHGTPSGHR